MHLPLSRRTLRTAAAGICRSPRAVPGATVGTAVSLALAASLAASLTACGDSAEHDAAVLTHGSPERGRVLISTYGCGSCHTIPGIPGANATVGPPLAGIAGRSYIAGVLTNQPDHMVQWLLDPPGVDSKTAMPRVGLTTPEAHDVAAYLYTLR